MQTPANKLHLLLREGAFLYEYWDSNECIVEIQLSPKQAFCSHLTAAGENSACKSSSNTMTYIYKRMCGFCVTYSKTFVPLARNTTN